MSRVLVVDDDDQMLHLYEKIFEQAGFAVRKAPDAETALDIAREEDHSSFDLIVSDMHMNHLTGFDLYTILRRDCGFIGKFFLISGSCPEEPEGDFDRDPDSLFLGKPLNLDRLKRELSAVRRSSSANEKSIKNVLIIEDDQDFRELLSIELEGKFSITGARNGKQAVSLLNKKFDLLVIDLKLPEISGDNILRVLSCDASFRTPVIIASGYPELAREFRVLDIVHSVLEKPYTAGDLEIAIGALESGLSRTG